ncbi:hypothetical protein CH379_013390 [Leptospira ellisii]|uniref:Uncharacterized protein n=1 Tax=Leptospira ellisii TaxID=2023197 RepID=A0AAE4TWV1_9LEPT|nr:hypothetical protein [Leptospira ellisii]MDV6236618.1 hypothetical protein [Leptospira ellisii]
MAYADIFLSEQVKCVLASENWTRKDLDPKYLHYLQDYLRIAAANEDSLFTDIEALRQLLNARAKSRVEEQYKAMKASLLSLLRENFMINDTTYEMIVTRLAKFTDLNSFNLEYLEEMRKIEEELIENNGQFK